MRRLATLILVFVAVAGAVSIWWSVTDRGGTVQGTASDRAQVFFEKIPGSRFHSPDGTWWGYNQSKIVRYGNTVFMTVMENSDAVGKTLSTMVIYKKTGNGSWEKGAGLPTSEAGNLVVDHDGVLHAFVFQQATPTSDLSLGKLLHYWFPRSAHGDITTKRSEVIVENTDRSEPVNRVGAAAGSDGTLGVAYGLTKNTKYRGHSEHLHVKRPGAARWTRRIAGENLGHDWYYPFVLLDGPRAHLLAVQDDFNGTGKLNTYQKILYFGFDGRQWTRKTLGDLTNHPLAAQEKRLVEQNDLLLDSRGRLHASYKEFLDPASPGRVTRIQHFTHTPAGWRQETIPMPRHGCNWLKHVEVGGTLYYLCVGFDSVYVMNEARTRERPLNIPPAVAGIYPYLASPRTGTKPSAFVDLLLLSGSGPGYATHTDYYVRIPADVFRNL